jgi:hypothetical protein
MLFNPRKRAEFLGNSENNSSDVAHTERVARVKKRRATAGKMWASSHAPRLATVRRIVVMISP